MSAILSADMNFIRVTKRAVRNGIKRQNLPIMQTDEDADARCKIRSKIRNDYMEWGTYDLIIFIWATDPLAQLIFDLIEHFASVNASGLIETKSGTDYYLKLARSVYHVVMRFGFDGAVFRSKLAPTCKAFARNTEIHTLLHDAMRCFATHYIHERQRLL